MIYEINNNGMELNIPGFLINQELSMIENSKNYQTYLDFSTLELRVLRENILPDEYIIYKFKAVGYKNESPVKGLFVITNLKVFFFSTPEDPNKERVDSIEFDYSEIDELYSGYYEDDKENGILSIFVDGHEYFYSNIMRFGLNTKIKYIEKQMFSL